MDTKSAKTLTASLVALFAVFAMCSSAASVLMNHVIDAFAVQGAAQGLMNSLMQLGSFVAVGIIPLLQGRVRKWVMLGAGAVLQALAMLLSGGAMAFGMLLFACFAAGVGGGWIDSYANAAIVDIHPTDSPRYMGLVHGFYGIGAITAPLLIQALLAATNWRWAYAGVGVVALAVAVVFNLTLRRCRAGLGAAPPPVRLTRAALGLLLKDRYNTVVVVCTMCYCASQAGFFAWAARYMKVTYGSDALGALAISLFWGGTTLSRFIAPRLPVKPMALVAGGTALAAVAHAAGVLAGSAPFMLAMCAANGLFTGFCIPYLMNESISRYPGSTDLPAAVIMLTGKIPLLLAPLAAAAIAVYSMQGSFLLAAGFSLVTAGVALAAVRMGKKQEPDA